MFPGFELFGKFISSYMLTTLAGIFTACPIAISRYKKRGGNDISMIFVFLFGAIGCAVGMHLLYGITNIQYWGSLFSAGSFLEFWDAAQLIFGGSVFYGGLIGGLFAGFLSMRYQKLDYGLTADCAAPSIALFHAFGRVGCFLGGCCYGVEWEHGITFTNALVESANGVPRVPVQLFEAGMEFALFGLLSVMLAKGWLKNRLLEVYLLIYSVGRFTLEFWRGDEYRGFLFGLSTSQLISIAVFAAAVAMLIVYKFRRKESAPAE
ncbi:MAG: prolipoprotein diacylglyceryl transferase [Oscillospiraceae bacterium]|nr:prolipoprotein diacylglyceryl transferase [Oscillospiraceae bacterium]